MDSVMGSIPICGDILKKFLPGLNWMFYYHFTRTVRFVNFKFRSCKTA